jgi:PAS domain S-box-containing protein
VTPPNILVVDDDSATLAMMVRMLAPHGFRVRPADSGALALAAALAEPPDLVLLDVLMPGMGGHEVCRRLKADPRTREVPILLVSGSTELQDWVEGLRAGAADFIAKPVRAEELLHRLQTQLALRLARANEERFRAMFQAGPDALLLVGEEGSIRAANPAATRLLGWTEPELVARGYAVLEIPAGRLEEALNEHARLGRARTDLTFRRADGSTFEGEVTLARVGEAPGQPISVMALRDVTELRAASTALRASEERYRMLSENAADVIWVLDLATGRFEYVSPSVERLRGFSVAEVLAQSVSAALTPESAARVGELLARRVAGYSAADPSTGLFVDELDQVCRDGSIVPTEIATRFLPDDRGRPARILGVSRDIRERRQAEAKRQTLQTQLDRAQRLESLGRLASGVAHDMNNVLGAILGLASIHREEAGPDTGLREDLAAVEEACRRGQAMVTALLGFARQGLVEDKPFDLNELLRRAAGLLERTTLQRVRLQLDLVSPPPWVQGDPSSLSHALLNLCVNAVDAMPAGGTLILQTRTEDSSTVTLAVQDSGEGMAPEVLERALDPFFTTKAPGKGTGLGLPLVFATVRAHRGQLDIQSEPGRGTTVRITLPGIVAPRSAATAPAAPPAAKASGLKVLLVDDDAMVRRSLERMLHRLGHHCSSAESGERALEMVEGGLETDVVVLDLNMPGIGGAGTLPRLRPLRPRLPVLLSTGRVDQDALDLADRFAGVTILPKPFDARELALALDAVRAGWAREPC